MGTIKHLISLYHADSDLKDIIHIMYCLSVIVMTTADCERGFSLLKLIKTPLRNAIGQKNLNSAMMVSIEAKDGIDFKECVKRFANKKKRRVV